MKTFTVELTPEQGTALLQLIDLAVKSAGMQVAGPAVALVEILQNAHKAALTKEESASTVQ